MENHLDYRKKYLDMTEGPVGKQVCKLAIPTMVSMLITALYNAVDTFFVSTIGTQATAAVGVAFSIMIVIQALGFFFGQGAGNCLSRALGRQDVDRAVVLVASGFTGAFLSGLLLCVVVLIFRYPFVRILGATDDIVELTADYITPILLAAPMMCPALALNNIFRYQGKPVLGMIGIAAGAVLNVALDALFILRFGMGVTGAALATFIGQTVSFFILLANTRRDGVIPIKLNSLKYVKTCAGEIVGGGMPSLMRQGLTGVSSICMSRAAGSFGVSAIAAISIVNRICAIIHSSMIGFAHGYQPVCGFCYGAGKYTSVKEAFWFCLKLSVAVPLALSAIMFPFAKQIIGLFGNVDAEVLKIGTEALRLNSLVFVTFSWSILSNSTLQTIGRTKPATFLAATKQGVYFIPAVLLLPKLFGIRGLEMTQMVSDLLTFATAVPLQMKVLREFGQAAEAQV